MSVVWKCDYPECGKIAVEHKGWARIEVMDRKVWLLLAIPIIGNFTSFCCYFDPRGVHHYCPEHAKFLGML